MCYIDVPVIFCSSASLLSIFTIGLLANVFVTYYVFCYCRLLSVYQGSFFIILTLGSTELWSGFKIAFAVNTLLSVLVFPILSVILDGFVAYEGPTENPSIIYLLLGVSILIWGIAILISSIYCFSQMLYIILTSSAKLAKMKRNEGAHLVHALRRRLFSHIGAAAFMGAITIISFFIGKLKFSYILYTQLCYWISFDPDKSA
jgi:hypothetical protein